MNKPLVIGIVLLFMLIFLGIGGYLIYALTRPAATVAPTSTRAATQASSKPSATTSSSTTEPPKNTPTPTPTQPAQEGVLDLGLFTDACPADWVPAGSGLIDFREGCRGEVIRMCQKKGTDVKGLQSVYVVNEGPDAPCPPEHEPVLYNGQQYNINTGCGGDKMYVCLKKVKAPAPFLKDVVISKHPTYANYNMWPQSLKNGTGKPALYLGTI